MTKYVIEQGVPIPRFIRPRDADSRMGVIRRLEVGQSFFVECLPSNVQSVQQSISASARTILRRDGVKIRIVTRTVEGGVRVWRVE